MAITRREAIFGGAGAVAGAAAGAAAVPLLRSISGGARGGSATAASLTMHYSGLVGLVREKQPSPGNMADFGRMYGLLTDTKYLRDSGILDLDEHMPVLKVRALLVQNGGDFAQYLRGHFFEIPLKGQIVSTKLGGSSTVGQKVVGSIRADAPNLMDCPQGDKWNELTWLPNIDLVIKTGAKKVKTEYLTRSDLTNTPVASRIDMGGGALVCGPPSMYSASQYRAQFSDNSLYHHATTDTVRHVSPAAGSVSIVFTKFGSALPIKEMVLDVSYGAIDVDVENMRHGAYDPNKPHHFKAYYAFLDGYSNDRHVPLTGSQCGQYMGQPDWPLYCPPAFMS